MRWSAVVPTARQATPPAATGYGTSVSAPGCHQSKGGGTGPREVGERPGPVGPFPLRHASCTEQTLEQRQSCAQVGHGVCHPEERRRRPRGCGGEPLGRGRLPPASGLGELHHDAAGLAGVEEGFHPVGTAEVHPHGCEARVAGDVESGGEVGHLEGEVVGAGTVAVEEASQERVVLGPERLEDLDPPAVGVAQLGGPETDVEAPRAPPPAKLDGVARPGHASDHCSTATATWSSVAPTTGEGIGPGCRAPPRCVHLPWFVLSG